MPGSDKILVALDVPDIPAAQSLVKQLAPHVGGFKVGLELMNHVGAPQIVEAVRDAGGMLFFDGKFHDIPNTVAGAVRGAILPGIGLLNVHCLGGPAMMKGAKEAAITEASAQKIPVPKVIGVTILTSMNVAELQAIGMQQIKESRDITILVGHLALEAKKAGLDGVVSSPQEISLIRELCGPDFLIVTPGVRPTWAATGDQKRVMTPKDAVAAGADYLVIGRPITNPPKEIGSPADAAQKIIAELQ
ncbi:MAG: orotidine-5'-phosphate decarboxylase [Deltaproteobacteria bacterium CG11_big_fil_rev_8_21_14_0_20_47_16]|nr:MAG: orotidine-5'-phosphate decarboxylase [Deltaproteobacteria bacterium CG11_big_fil_rev_8_21_14_0_20_47_16]